jgi:hypothetical protein
MGDVACFSFAIITTMKTGLSHQPALRPAASDQDSEFKCDLASD